MAAEVPAGALADRYSRRAALVVSGVLQAAGYVVWTTAPTYPGFAAGFVLWGLGGALGSGALEALVYDALDDRGAAVHYPRVAGRITAARLCSQLPTAGAATVLFSTGGYELVGWASVACCLAAATVATRLPESRRRASTRRGTDAEDGLSYIAILRSGLAEAIQRPAVRSAVVAATLVGGMGGLEEYVALVARDWGIATPVIPVAMVVVPLVGAAGAALGGRASSLRPSALAALLGGALLVLGAAGAAHRPVGMAGLALAYGLHQLVLVVTDVRLQDRIEGPARATVTSVASLGTEITAAAFVVVWALSSA